MRYILIILVFLSVGVNAQMVIKAHANYRPLVQPVTNLLLDDYPNAAAAYSLRKLDKDYTGSAIRIRKDTTGQPEQDIGFTASGDLDTAALKSFLNARSGFVVTWYSQGDSLSVNFSQSTQASQPRIALNGVIERRLGEPSIFFDGSNDFMDISSSTSKFNFLHQVAGDASLFFAIQPGIVANPNNIIYNIINNNNYSSSSAGYSLTYNDDFRNDAMFSFLTRGIGGAPFVQNSTNADFAPANVFNLYTNLIDNNSTLLANRNFLYRNGANENKNNITSQGASTANASFNMRIGRHANSTGGTYTGFMSEIIIYPNISVSKSGVESNINSYYGIY